MNKNGEKETFYDFRSRITTQEEHLSIITKQEKEIARLRNELSTIKTERDRLIIEVSRLKFELEISDNSKKLYSLRSSKSRGLTNCINGSTDFPNGFDDDEPNSDTDDITAEDFNNYDPCQYEWHRSISINSSIRNNSTELANYSRGTVESYELSQDLFEKQIELLERKYGGTRAREAATIIQRAFRRHQLIKKFTLITEMVKAEKGSARRLHGHDGGKTTLHVSGANSGEYTCEGKSGTCLQPMNLTPTRSLSMREKRLAEVESGSNSLPRTYVGRCTNCTYCCSAATNSCAACCIAAATTATPTPHINYCPSYCFKQSHLNTPDVTRSYHQPHLANCTSNAAVAFVAYSSPMANSSGHRKYSGQYVYQNTASLSSYQINSSECSVPQVSTPKRVPPEVPKRTSSISFKGNDGNERMMETNYSGSMSSVQSSSSDSSSTMNISNISTLNSTNCSLGGTWNRKQVTETMRKRQYRVGLNLFNKKPEKGIAYLVQKGFLEDNPASIARFLVQRKGLSKETIGEYLGGREQYNQAVLERYMNDIDLSGMQVDVALRKFVTCFKLPGEAQKIERLMKAFSDRYCRCNRDVVAQFKDPDTVFVLAFAIIMLNSDLHTPSMKDENRMKLDEFIKNLSRVIGIDTNIDMLCGIYERVKAHEFKDGNDHVSQVKKVESTIVGLKMMIAQPHRRLVCYCRLYEVPDVNKKEKVGVHQREVFLFNDLLVITKIQNKKKNAVTYTYRQSFSLSGLHITVFESQYYQYGIQLMNRVRNLPLVTFNARNDHDRTKFVEDIREAIMEMDEMENIRIEGELERQKNSRANRCSTGNSTENRDSGVADVEVYCLHGSPPTGNADDTKNNQPAITRTTRSNSLLDIHDQDKRPHRSGSVGSLDSGMSVSFQSTSSTLSRMNMAHVKRSSPKMGNISNTTATSTRTQAFLANFFSKGKSASLEIINKLR